MLFTAPGWGPSVDLYLPGLQRLQDRFTVAWVDPRRTGRSGSPADSHYDLDALVGDFDAVRRALGWETMWVGGHSMGGHLVLRYLAAYSEFCSGVLGLCTFGDMDEEYRTEMRTRLHARWEEPWFSLAADALSRNITTEAELEEGLADALPAYLVDQSNLEELRRAFSTVALSAQAFPYLDRNREMSVLSRVRGLRVPALIVAPDGDFICSPPLGRRIHEALPNSTFVEIHNSGHFPWIEQPEQFWRAVDVGLAAYLTPA
jgi:pimeloyl-ACP methyl ester carboxylesterase